MESHGKNGSSLITRRVQASIACVGVAPQTKPSGSGGEPEFAVQLKCHVTKYIRAGRGRELERVYRGGGAEASFATSGPRDVPCDEDGVRGVMRQLLRAIRPLRDLDLTDEEWEAILPEDVVPQLADLARDGGAPVVVELTVDRHVRFSVARVLMTGCKEAAGGKDGGDCSICFDTLRQEEEAAAGKGGPVQLPGCAHAFHHQCISKWFVKKPTCPLCRGDVTKHLDPDLQKHLAEFGDEHDYL